MVQYVLKRILMLVPIVLCVIFIIFALMYNLPGSNIARISAFGEGDALDAVYERFGVGENVLSKYIRYSYNLFVHLDFGKAHGVNIMRDLGLRIQLTALLTLLGTLFTVLIGVPLGVYSAMRRNRWQDNSLMLTALVLSSVPNYCLALLLVMVFVVRFSLLPLFGFSSPAHFVLPVATLTAGGVASLLRMTRASVVEVLDQPYITALRSKGLAGRQLYAHVLKNAMVPVVSVLGSLVSQLLCGSLVVESWFSIAGLGGYMLSAVGSRNHYALLTCTVLLTFMLSLISIVTDVAYAVVNPQIKLQYTAGKSAGKD